MKKDTRQTASYEELRQDAATHWKQVGQTRDARYETVQRMRQNPWRCPVCRRNHDRGVSVCPTCREARILEVE